MAPAQFDMSSTSLVESLGPVDADAAAEPYQATPALMLRHLDELLGVVRGFLSDAGIPVNVGVGDVYAYFEVKRRNPAYGQNWTTPGNLSFWLFQLVRALQPQVIVESGVLRGSSLFSLRCASPTPKIYAFDLDFSNLAFRTDTIDYREHDWGTDDVRAVSPTDFCYFNDHINNCLRIRQCYDRGFKHLVLDDSPNLGELQAYRYPAIPTVSMIAGDKLKDGDAVEWIWQGERLRYTFSTEHTFGAKALIDHCHPIPRIHPWTGLPDSHAYYVKLK
ncbi:MAG: hypothetical protein HY060_04140 [Proteobacteria bacterium]|nr:hypothetical protein [Pseudomonadota bacterium]